MKNKQNWFKFFVFVFSLWLMFICHHYYYYFDFFYFDFVHHNLPAQSVVKWPPCANIILCAALNERNRAINMS